jgi:bifunctional DNA-binding transcriptional regulator/antitoxin component of YhaV-PrlF toxin-antitoxin module
MVGLIRKQNRPPDVIRKVRVTVDVDARGRFTIPEPARRALTLTEDKVGVRLDIRVLLPNDAEGNRATFDTETDERGRVTIQPSELRDDLGIKGIESVVEAGIAKLYENPENEGDS